MNKSKAIVLMILSSFSFAIMGAFVKFSGEIGLMTKVFFRDIVVVLTVLFILLKNKENPFGKKENRLKLLIRGISGFIGVALYFYSVNKLYLGDAAILNKLSPFWTTLFSVIFFKEKISKLQFPALILAFIGGIFVLKPSFDNVNLLAGLAGFTGAIVAGISYAIVIDISDKENPYSIVFYFSLSSVVISFPFVINEFLKINTLETFIYLLLTGVFAAIGQILLTFSYKFSKSSDVSLYSYSVIIFSMIIGFIIWKEVLDFYSLIGAALIFISGIIIYIRYKIKNKA